MVSTKDFTSKAQLPRLRTAFSNTVQYSGLIITAQSCVFHRGEAIASAGAGWLGYGQGSHSAGVQIWEYDPHLASVVHLIRLPGDIRYEVGRVSLCGIGVRWSPEYDDNDRDDLHRFLNLARQCA